VLGLDEEVQDVAFVLDQESVVDSPNVTVLGDREILTVVAGGGGALLPHPASKDRTQTRSTSDAAFFIESSRYRRPNPKGGDDYGQILRFSSVLKPAAATVLVRT
jgi:hypothetical protein